MSGQLYITQVTEATWKTNCPKQHFAPPPFFETPKDITTKSGESHVRDKALYVMQILKPIDRREISTLTKIRIFPYGGLPCGLLFHAIHIWKAVVQPMLRPI